MTFVTGGMGLGGTSGGTIVTAVESIIAKLKGNYDHYPPLPGAIDAWHWGKAKANLPYYVSEIQRDVYRPGKVGANSILYEQAGPSFTNMKAIQWVNDGSFFSHHTAPDTDPVTGNSTDHVSPLMKPGSDDFGFGFGIKSISPQPSGTFYYFFDYDAQDAPTPFKPGIQFLVSGAGGFAPATFLVLIIDDIGQFHEAKYTFASGVMLNDNVWNQAFIKIRRALTLPQLRINGTWVTMTKVFGVDINQLSSINPQKGIRFGMREFGEAQTGRANMAMCGAVYFKNMGYDWPYWTVQRGGMPSDQKLSIIQGEKKTLQITIKDQADAVVDLTGASAWFTVKHNKGVDADGSAIKQYSVGSGITLTTPTSGILSVAIAEADFKTVPRGEYDYDLKIKLSGGDILYAMLGHFEVKENVTETST